MCLTGTLGVGNAPQEDGDEPLEGVLVHGVNGGQVSHTEEEDLGVDGHRDVERPRLVYVLLCLLGNHHFGLEIQR